VGRKGQGEDSQKEKDFQANTEKVQKETEHEDEGLGLLQGNLCPGWNGSLCRVVTNYYCTATFLHGSEAIAGSDSMS